MQIAKIHTKFSGYNAADNLQAALADFQFGGRDISFEIVVDSRFSYWWILEYGSSPATRGDIGPKPYDEIQLQLPENAKPARHHTTDYPIEPRGSWSRTRHLRGTRSKRSNLENKYLKFYDPRLHRWSFRKAVDHPGIRGTGFIRLIMARVLGALTEDLLNIWAEDELPTKREVIQIVNRYARYILDQLREHTPVDEPVDSDGFAFNEDEEGYNEGGHLRDAWVLRQAK